MAREAVTISSRRAVLLAMKAYREMQLQLHSFSISALDAGEWSASRPDRFTPTEKALGVR